MASALYILDSKGAPLIARSYRGDIEQSVSAVFQRRVLGEEDYSVKPIFEEEGHTYIWFRHQNVYFLTVSRVNCIPAIHLTFMRRCIDVFNGYFDRVTEESVQDNFVIIYELLDEMMDFGYPQYTETKILKEYITQEGFKLNLVEDDQLKVQSLPSAVTGMGGATPWRPPGIKHRKNEVFLDVIESINLLIGPDGETLHSEIIGCLKMKCQLSGMPELKLGLNDKVLFEATGKKAKGKTVELEDIQFHQCVKLNRFESDRTINFIPPDGDFDLMSYRLEQKVRPLIQVEAQIVRHGSSRVEMLLKAKSTFKKTSQANFVDILIPIPSDADPPKAKAATGTVQYQPDNECVLWRIKNVPGGKEYLCNCTFTLPSVRAADPNALSKKPITVRFEIPYFTVSGFQVRYLKVTEKSNYEAMPWVRYLTQSGEYQIRTS